MSRIEYDYLDGDAEVAAYVALRDEAGLGEFCGGSASKAEVAAIAARQAAAAERAAADCDPEVAALVASDAEVRFFDGPTYARSARGVAGNHRPQARDYYGDDVDDATADRRVYHDSSDGVDRDEEGYRSDAARVHDRGVFYVGRYAGWVPGFDSEAFARRAKRVAKDRRYGVVREYGGDVVDRGALADVADDYGRVRVSTRRRRVARRVPRQARA
jgi:hypothetical protein